MSYIAGFSDKQLDFFNKHFRKSVIGVVIAGCALGYYMYREEALDKKIQEGFLTNAKVQIGNGVVHFGKGEDGEKMTIVLSNGEKAILTYPKAQDIIEVSDKISRAASGLKNDPRFPTSTMTAPMDADKKPQQVR